MLATNATRPARLSETMRPARRSQPSSRCQPRTGGLSMATPSNARDAETPSAFRLGSGCVRSSNGQNCRLFSMAPLEDALPLSYPRQASASVNNQPVSAWQSGFLEAVADAVQGFDHLEIVVHDLELLAQPLDVAVDGAIVDIDLVVIGRVHQGVAAFHDAGAGGQRLQDQKFRHGQRHRLVLPGAGMTLRIHA